MRVFTQHISTLSIQRLTSLAVVAGLAIAMSGCNVDLYSHQKERDVNEMLAVLLQSGIDADKKHQGDGSYTLQVDESERAMAIGLLESHGLPRQEHMTMRDLFPGNSIVASPLEERARFIFALEQSLQETLSLIDGVLSARVHVVLPENNPFANTLQPSSASVFLKTHASIDLDSKRSDIKRIVSNSIEGLNYRDVTLTVIASTTRTSRSRQQQPQLASQGYSLVSVLMLFAIVTIVASTIASVATRLRKNAKKV